MMRKPDATQRLRRTGGGAGASEVRNGMTRMGLSGQCSAMRLATFLELATVASRFLAQIPARLSAQGGTTISWLIVIAPPGLNRCTCKCERPAPTQYTESARRGKRRGHVNAA